MKRRTAGILGIPWTALSIVVAAAGPICAQQAQTGGVAVRGDVHGNVIIINGGSAESVPREYANEGARWLRAGETVDVLDGQVSITAVKIHQFQSHHVVFLKITAPRRHDVKDPRVGEGESVRFEYREQKYRADVLDVKLDDQQVLLRIKKA